MAAGNTGILSTTAGVSQGFVSRLCASGYATIDATTNNYFCAAAPKNTITTGQTTAAQCSVTVTDSTGKTSTSNTVLAACGYNQDANFYCPYAVGDAPVQAVMTALNTANFYSLRNKNCNPSSSGSTCAYFSKFSTATQIAYNQIQALWSGLSANAQYLQNSQYFENNAACIMKTLTSTYFGSFSKVMGFSLLALGALLN